MKVIFAALLVALFTVAAQACPDYRLGGKGLSYNATELYQSHSFKVIAGGEEDLERCDIRVLNPPPRFATGYVTESPDFELDYSSTRGYALELRVESECDAVLLVNTGAGNWYFDDDDNGNLDPKIRLTQPSGGIYDVWIGTFDGDACDAVLILETF
ncbi:MAG: hypothetical protein WEB63_07360 [Cucumibacter sp.]